MGTLTRILWRARTGLIALGAGLFLAGCSTIKDYSVTSYDGPLPLHDYRFLERTKE